MVSARKIAFHQDTEIFHTFFTLETGHYLQIIVKDSLHHISLVLLRVQGNKVGFANTK